MDMVAQVRTHSQVQYNKAFLTLSNPNSMKGAPVTPSYLRERRGNVAPVCVDLHVHLRFNFFLLTGGAVAHETRH
jgi:hypothetical protein